MAARVASSKTAPLHSGNAPFKRFLALCPPSTPPLPAPSLVLRGSYNEHNPAAQGKIAMPASWFLLAVHSSCIKQPIKHHAPRSLGLQRCSQYPACPHSQPRSSVPSLLQPASSPASSGGSRWSGALRPAGSTFAAARAVAGARAVARESFLAASCRTYLVGCRRAKTHCSSPPSSSTHLQSCSRHCCELPPRVNGNRANLHCSSLPCSSTHPVEN